MNIRPSVYLASLLSLSLAACGGGGGGGAAPPATNPTELSQLEFAGVTLSPSFRPDVKSYTATVANTVAEVSLTLKAADTRSLVLFEGVQLGVGTGTTTVPLAVGANPLLASVVTGAGDFGNYEVTITREGLAGPGAVLTDLAVEPGQLSAAFDPMTTIYQVPVGYFVRNWFVTASADPDAMLIVNGEMVASGERKQIDLLLGVNDVVIRVVRGGNTMDYALQVERAARSTVAERAYLKASNTDAGDRFGSSVAVSGDTMVVGAPNESSNATGVNGDESDDTAANAGAAYVLVHDGTSWVQQAYLKGTAFSGGDLFGSSVAIDGDTIVIGAPEEDSGATGVNGNPQLENQSNSGAAFVFVREGDTWAQQAYLKASNTGFSDLFGTSVAISGDTIVVGAILEDSPSTSVNGGQGDGLSNSGAAYVFRRTGTTWAQEAYLKSSEASAFDEFGSAVAIDGDNIVVGAPQHDGGGSVTPLSDSGRAYVFSRNGSTWSQVATLAPLWDDVNDKFGASVAIDGGTIVVGSPFEDSASGIGAPGGAGVNVTDDSVADSGAAFVFFQDGANWPLRYLLKAENPVNFIGNEAGAQFGSSVAVKGAVIAVGSPLESSSTTGVDGLDGTSGAADSGAVYMFQRASETVVVRTVYVKPSNTGAGDQFGASVAVNGDSVIVGANAEDGAGTGSAGSPLSNGASDSGAVYVVR